MISVVPMLVQPSSAGLDVHSCVTAFCSARLLPQALHQAADLTAAFIAARLVSRVEQTISNEQRTALVTAQRLLEAFLRPDASIEPHQAAQWLSVLLRLFAIQGSEAPRAQAQALADLEAITSSRPEPVLHQVLSSARFHVLSGLIEQPSNHVELAQIESLAQKILNAEPASAARAAVLSQLALGWLQRGNSERAQSLLQQALEHSRDENNAHNASILLRLGDLQQSRGRLQAARGHYQRAMEFIAPGEASTVLAATFLRLGNLSRAEGQQREAAAWYQRALEQQRLTDDLPGQQSSLTKLAALAKLQGECLLAETLLREALSLALLQGEPAQLAEAYLELSRLGQRLERIDQARADCLRGLSLLAQTAESPRLALGLCLMGDLETRSGQLAQAIDYYQQSVAVYDRTGPAHLSAVPYARLGDLAKEQGKHAQAASWYEKALTSAETRSDSTVLEMIRSRIRSLSPE